MLSLRGPFRHPALLFDIVCAVNCHLLSSFSEGWVNACRCASPSMTPKTLVLKAIGIRTDQHIAVPLYGRDGSKCLRSVFP